GTRIRREVAITMRPRDGMPVQVRRRVGAPAIIGHGVAERPAQPTGPAVSTQATEGATGCPVSPAGEAEAERAGCPVDHD
ncbi:MAG: hypothetical protein Q7T55_13990, partial [Solirubrobacteraceae bacterium]|nr:hypothetical protein [Solirubrobacteraceae bacterium]